MIDDACNGFRLAEAGHHGSGSQRTRSEGLAVGLPRLNSRPRIICDDSQSQRLGGIGFNAVSPGFWLNQRVQEVLAVGGCQPQFATPGLHHGGGRGIRFCQGGHEGLRQAASSGSHRCAGPADQRGQLAFAEVHQLSAHPLVVLHGFEADLPVARTQDESGQRVIILAADGVELVVVAAGAGDGQAQERLGEDIDLVIDPVAFVLADIHR